MNIEKTHYERIIPVTSDNEAVLGNNETSSDAGENAMEYIEQLKRLQAEFTNYRNRTEKEWASVRDNSKRDLINRLLPIIDDFYRLIEHHTDDAAIEMNGIILMYKNLMKILLEEGLEEIKALGEIFNPEVHEAVGVLDAPENQDDVVLEEWQKGYQFKGKLLRPSRVNVGRFTGKAGDQ